MGKKIFYTAICLASILFITGCGQKASKFEDENQQESKVLETEDKKESMPEIVFEYTFWWYETTPNSHKFMFIDRYGNIYHGDSETYFCKAEEKMSLYETFINAPYCEKTETIDMEQLQQKYDILKQIAVEGKNEVVIEESQEDVCLGQHFWRGYFYDDEGNLDTVILSGAGNSRYINNDMRAKEIADWMDDLSTMVPEQTNPE